MHSLASPWASPRVALSVRFRYDEAKVNATATDDFYFLFFLNLDYLTHDIAEQSSKSLTIFVM